MPHVELPSAEFKVVLLGDTHTGKTCLVLRFVDGSYKPASRSSTIGAFFLTKRLTVDHITAKMMIWDTAGQEKFQKLTVTYYQNAAAAILCFDVSNAASLTRLRKNLQDLAIYQERDDQKEGLVVVVAACKTDLPPADPTVVAEARRLAALYQASYMETSAKQNIGVQEVFHETAREVLHRHAQAVQSGGRPIAVTVGGGGTTSRHGSPTKSPQTNGGGTPHSYRLSPRLMNHKQRDVSPSEKKDSSPYPSRQEPAKCDSSTENESDEVLALDADRLLPNTSTDESAFSPKKDDTAAACDGTYLVCGVEDVNKGCTIM